MGENRSGTIYLDQNILSHLREGQPAREEISRALASLRAQGIFYVYSSVHVEECRAFANPEQYVEVIDALDGYYLRPAKCLGQHRETTAKIAKDLILSENDFAGKGIGIINNSMLMVPYALGWLGELEADELLRELKDEIKLWAKECERETSGHIIASTIFCQTWEPFASLDLQKLKRDGLEHQLQTEREWNCKFSRIDNLPTEEVVDFLFSEIECEAAQHLRDMFPKGDWPNGAYQKFGNLAGLAFFLFTQGVGRDSKVKKGRQSNRRKRFQAQFRDCRHIEEAAGCTLFLSGDAGAVKLAQAVYAYAGVRTTAARLTFSPLLAKS